MIKNKYEFNGEDMEIKSFYKNQRELAGALSDIIDRYWFGQFPEAEMIDCVTRIVNGNLSKVYTGVNGEYTTVLRQQCGKKRLEVISKVLAAKQSS